MPHILLIEDDQNLAYAVCEYFRDHNFQISHVANGIDGFTAGASDKFDFIILDVILPGLDGVSLCRKLRKYNIETPILMLTSKSQVDEIVEGIEVGADGYMSKPFSLKELLARTRGLLQRTPISSQRIVQIGELVIDLQRKTIQRGDIELKLRRKEFMILEILIREKGRIVTRDELIKQSTALGFADIYPSTIDVNISRIRKVLGRYKGKQIVETAHGVGYRIMNW